MRLTYYHCQSANKQYTSRPIAKANRRCRIGLRAWRIREQHGTVAASDPDSARSNGVAREAI